MGKITYGDKSAINVNASIPEANKITDANMNDIKGAINQIGSFIPLTAGANAYYYSTFKGTLETGDIFSGYFPLATNGSSNAKLSVNGSGGTYINLVYFDGTQVLGNEVSLKYKSMYYDGTNFVLLDESFSRTNTNGTYTRYKDGTMTCYRTINIGGTSTDGNADGSLFYVDISLQHNFASTFNSIPACTARVYTNSDHTYHGLWVSTKYNSVTTTYFSNYRIYSPTNTTIHISIEIIAIGRWKA